MSLIKDAYIQCEGSLAKSCLGASFRGRLICATALRRVSLGLKFWKSQSFSLQALKMQFERLLRNFVRPIGLFRYFDIVLARCDLARQRLFPLVLIVRAPHSNSCVQSNHITVETLRQLPDLPNTPTCKVFQAETLKAEDIRVVRVQPRHGKGKKMQAYDWLCSVLLITNW